jgi:hypothetical protein
MIKMKNILTENMRRFNTKNLNEQDSDSNNNGYPDKTEQIDNNFNSDVKFAKSSINWVMSIADQAETARNMLIKTIHDMEYTRRFDLSSMGFQIRPYSDQGPYGNRGFLYLNSTINDQDFEKINNSPEFKKYFEDISKGAWRYHGDVKYNTEVRILRPEKGFLTPDY